MGLYFFLNLHHLPLADLLTQKDIKTFAEWIKHVPNSDIHICIIPYLKEYDSFSLYLLSWSLPLSKHYNSKNMRCFLSISVLRQGYMYPKLGLHLPCSWVWPCMCDPLVPTLPVQGYRHWTTIHPEINMFYIKHSQGLVSIWEGWKVNRDDPGPRMGPYSDNPTVAEVLVNWKCMGPFWAPGNQNLLIAPGSIGCFSLLPTTKSFLFAVTEYVIFPGTLPVNVLE